MKFRLVDELILDLESISIRHPLYEVHKDIKSLYTNVTKDLRSKGRVDVRGFKLSSFDDMARLCRMFRDSRYETFRLIIVKNDSVIGMLGVSARLPDASPIFRKGIKDDSSQIAKGLYEYKKVIERLDADGYYILHNHPSGSTKPSRADIQMSSLFVKNIPGFLGSVIVGDTKYTILTLSIDKQAFISADGEFNDRQDDNSIKYCVQSGDDIAKLGKDFLSQSNKSIVLYTDSSLVVNQIVDINNSAFSDPNVFRYFDNERKKCGAVYYFIYTEDYRVYEKCLDNAKFIEDALYYDGKSVHSLRFERDIPTSDFTVRDVSKFNI